MTERDLCELLDRLSRDSEVAMQTGQGIFEAAQKAELVRVGDIDTVGRWMGKLIAEGLAGYRLHQYGPQTSPPPGQFWGGSDLQRCGDYYLTREGHADAEQTRRYSRERRVDALLEQRLVLPLGAGFAEHGTRAVAECEERLRTALLSADHAAAIGAAKELVESVARAVLEARGETPSSSVKLADLFRQAWSSDPSPEPPGWSLSRSLLNILQKLTELRNQRGTGHGRAAPSMATAQEATLAAGAASVLSAALVEQLGDAG